MHELPAPSLWRGHPVRVVFEWANGRRHTARFTRIDLEAEIDASMYIGGADGGYGAREPHVAFALPNLVSSAMVGAPRALATMIARGDVAKKLDGIRAEGFGIRRLTIGRKAKRDGCRTNGVHLEIEGWPENEAQLAILLDAVVEIATEARLERASRATRGVCGPHPEVVAYERADEQARRTGVRLAAGVLATCMALAGFVIAATAIMAPV